jgi:hypothetical protein
VLTVSRAAKPLDEVGHALNKEKRTPNGSPLASVAEMVLARLDVTRAP